MGCMTAPPTPMPAPMQTPTQTSTRTPTRSTAAPGSTLVRATLRPGTVVVIRDATSVQVGLAPGRTTAVRAPSGCGPRGLAALLNGLSGGAELERAAIRAGIDDDDLPAVARILVRLAELGHVGLDGAGITRGHPVDPGPRPSPVRRVHIVGSGQISEVLRGPLAVNGSRVGVSASPGLEFNPEKPPWRSKGARPDLVILTDSVSVDPVVAATLNRNRQPHLHVHGRDGRVIVGPTVVPGSSPCLRCTDLYRASRDPRWPFVAAQLVEHYSEVGVPALTAAAALVLSEVAATRQPDTALQTIGATVEINPAEGLWERVEWPVDPACGCGAPSTSHTLS